MGKNDKHRSDEGRHGESKKKHGKDDYSDDGRSGKVKDEEYYREKERKKREKEEKKKHKGKDGGGEHAATDPKIGVGAGGAGGGYPPSDSFGYSAQVQGRPPPPQYAQYVPHQGYAPPPSPGRQHSPYGAGVYATGGGYQPAPPGPAPMSPGYGSFQGPPAPQVYSAAGGYQAYAPPYPGAPGPPGPQPAVAQQYGPSSGNYGYPPQPQPQPPYGQSYPTVPHPPSGHPTAPQGYPAHELPPRPVELPAVGPAGGLTGSQHYKPQHHSAQQQQAYFGQGAGATTGSGTTPSAAQFEGTNPANPHSKPCSGGLKPSALTTFTGALTSSLHSYARTLFPATTTGAHKPGDAGAPPGSGNRYGSFAMPRGGNGVKWYVDGKDYMYAVSIAIENARESIWILDWWLSPELYLRRPPKLNERYRIDVMLKAAAERGVRVNVIVYKEVTQALSLSSHHTKTSLENLHPNITVFRHPDHLPDRPTVQSDIVGKITSGTYQLGDGLKGLYGMKDGVTLYWAHHEKLCLIDGEIAFMGGLDLCFGRWDMNYHPIADAHPSDLNAIIFPGQDFNNSRFMDFHKVDHWDQNKVSRLEHSRMGWSDVALSLIGPAVRDLQRHFLERWNFIYYTKYEVRNQPRLQPLDERILHERGHYRGKIKGKVHDKMHNIGKRLLEGRDYPPPSSGETKAYEEERAGYQDGGIDDLEGVSCQIIRSSAKWSHGLETTERSIAQAYIETIRNAQFFIYIENQFFITATSKEQSPILNRIGEEIYDRILTAARSNQKFKIIVVIPAVPAFAGDLKAEGSLGTRAIMEFQYRSINNDRGYSIMERLEAKGVNAMEYIRFYNLRNYDRINASRTMAAGEARAGVSFQAAAAVHDQQVGGGYPTGPGIRGDEYARYQRAAPQSRVGSEWDTVSQCCMLGGIDIRSAPWDGDAESELNAFVSEELYVHSKLLIADDRVVICGSANLNDRSQLGDHDSEIAIVIQDPTPLPSNMNRVPYQASHFAATLRRQIFRKHLGLIPATNLTAEDENMHPVPVPNIYDFDSPEDALVADPLDDEFQHYWDATARTNMLAFEKAFHAVPTDRVANWKQYDEYWGKHFRQETAEGSPPPKTAWGHVVREEFSRDPVQAVKELKNVLSTVRGHLVEMPLGFLKEEDIAKEGLGLNALTESLYT